MKNWHKLPGRMPMDFDALEPYARGLFWEIFRRADDNHRINLMGRPLADVVKLAIGSTPRLRRTIDADLAALVGGGFIVLEPGGSVVLNPEGTATALPPHSHDTATALAPHPEDTRNGLGSNSAESLNTGFSRIEKSREEERRKEETSETASPVSLVFDHWRQVMGHPNAKLDGNRRRAIDKAVKAYGVDGCIKAIDGCKASKWHMGENDRHRRYDSIELIFRNAEKTEHFMTLASAERPRTAALNMEEHRRLAIERVNAINSRLRTDAN